MSKHRILITGASGFIGGYVLQQLLPSGLPITAVMSASANCDKLLAQFNNLKVIYGNLLFYDNFCKNIDTVIHCAAKTTKSHDSIDPQKETFDPKSYNYNNCLATIQLLENARRSNVRFFLTLSSKTVYGKGMHRVGAKLHPDNVYAASKACGDMYTLLYNSEKMRTAVLRLSDVYGPGQHADKMIPKFIVNALRGDDLPIYGSGVQSHKWVYISDVFDAINVIISKRSEHDSNSDNIWHLTGNEQIANIDLAKKIIAMVNEIRPSNSDIAYFPNDRKSNIDSCSLYGTTIIDDGWTPTVSIDEGLRMQIAHLAKRF